MRLGKVLCEAWENHADTVGVWYTLTFSRLYQDDGGELRAAKTFGRDDLLVVAEAAREMFRWREKGDGTLISIEQKSPVPFSLPQSSSLVNWAFGTGGFEHPHTVIQ